MSFPKGFLWGTSVSAAQIEGGWDEGGKSPVMLDYAGVASSHTGSRPVYYLSAKAAKIAHSLDPSIKVGAMICGACSYPLTPDPKDVLGNYLQFQHDFGYAGDTMFRGAYPSYAPRIWAENGVSFEISGDDRHRRWCKCPAKIHPGDTKGAGSGMEKLLGPDHTCSKTRDQGGFGWQRCESHRRAHPLSGYGARPLIIN